MTHRARLATALLLLTSALTAVAGLPTGAATADTTGPDTTPPQVRLNPCFHGTSCQRVRAEVFGNLEPGDDLAVTGARIGDRVLTEHVYDDGTGFTPYGPFWTYGDDVGSYFDYVISVTVPEGTHAITFYARDLEGNTSELTTTLEGPTPPGPVRHLKASLVGHHRIDVKWAPADMGGYAVAEYKLASPGLGQHRCLVAPPGGPCGRWSYTQVPGGWHRMTVTVKSPSGTGPARSVRVFVPRHQHRTHA